MFTGIIEEVGTLLKATKEGSNLRLKMAADFLNKLKVDQSIAHNGVCLTVENIGEDFYEVVVVKETFQKTTLGSLQENYSMNLERCMQLNDRLDGHMVQGHVDGLASVQEIKEVDGSWVFTFELILPSKLIVEKGSICINGVSLTAFNVEDESFNVTIIPYTFQNTNFHLLKEQDEVNLEFDIVGKYIQRMMQ